MLERNSQYVFKAKEVLKKINREGSVGYIVGESTRKLMLDIPVDYIEIFSILKKESVRKLLFDLELLNDEKELLYRYDGVKIKISFINSLNYDAEKFNEKYILKDTENISFTLIEFLVNQDFTINSLAMASDNKIIDPFNAKKDLRRKRIKSIYRKPKEQVVSNPLVILKGLVLVSELGYKLDRKTRKAFKAKARALKKLTINDTAPLMRLILTGPYYKKAYKYLLKTKAYRFLKGFKYSIWRFKEGYDDINKFNYDLMLATNMIKHKKYMDTLASSAINEVNLMRLVNLAIANPKGKYDVLTLYSHTLVELVTANQINHKIGRSKLRTKQITSDYDALPIKKTCDLKFKGEDILKLVYERTGVDYNGSPELVNLVDEIIINVLNGTIKNDYNEIRQFVLNNMTSILHCTINRALIKKTDDGETDNYESYYQEQVNNQNASNSIDVIEKLKKELNDEIELSIKRSGMLDGLSGKLRESSYATLRKVYYDIIINKTKYERLRQQV